jgi:hypothetical protein
MSEMVERVAREIFRNGIGELVWSAASDEQREACYRQARAAIGAMREPTDEMKRVLASAAKHGTEANGDLWPGKLMGELIDAALTTSPST